MRDRWEDQSLAFAAVFQAGMMVDQLAKTGTAPDQGVRPLIESIFIFDAATTEDVYGGRSRYRDALDFGLHKLLDIFDRTRKASRARETLEYSVGLLYLQRHLQRNAKMLALLGDRLRELQPMVERHGSAHPDVIMKLAELYQQTLSNLKFRIHVRGEKKFLDDPGTAAQIRALLLAGVRAALLWHQLGGRRWLLPFTRKRTLNALLTIT